MFFTISWVNALSATPPKRRCVCNKEFSFGQFEWEIGMVGLSRLSPLHGSMVKALSATPPKRHAGFDKTWWIIRLYNGNVHVARNLFLEKDEVGLAMFIAPFPIANISY